MKNFKIIFALVLFAVSTVRAADAPLSGSSPELTRLVAGSRWMWYVGEFDPNIKSAPRWIEFYKDGTARVPWEPLPQLWVITGPDVLTITGVGRKGSNYVFTMDEANKSGSQADNLHIQYDKRVSKPARRR